MGKISIEQSCVQALRVLSADQVQKAKSGHPGMPLGCAPMVYELWSNHLRHNPKNPKWVNRDRFLLSAGHGSALLYSLLHLFGYGLTIEDLKQFRQDGSLTPGHPEYGHTIGVEATTGPLGAGMGMAVGMAMAEAHLATKLNRPDFPVIDHYTYVIGGDGCMMEGVSYEVFSLAGTLKLGKLIVLYDSNRITIEGSTDLAFSEDVAKRMEALGFQTLTVEDGNDLVALNKAISAAKADTARPSFITIKTEIGYGCPAKQGKSSAHGEPLGEENIKILRQNIGWEEEEPFVVPQEVYDAYAQTAKAGIVAEEQWEDLFKRYCAAYPEAKILWDKYHAANGEQLFSDSEFWAYEDKPEATRTLSGIMINRLKDLMPQLLGGSADLGSSNKTVMKNAGDFSAVDYAGRNLHFGVREFGMAAIANGLAVHGGLRAYIGTFFVFSDYVKPMARLASIMGLPVTYVLTHDSIGVGEDGATHEPIEQLAMLRAMPNFTVFRPADATETASGWYLAATSRTTPVALVLTRQNLPQLNGSSKEALRGGYIVEKEAKDSPDAILVASGSEVALAIQAREKLLVDGLDVRVVSMPSMDLFEQQPLAYRESVLPSAIRARVAVEAGASFGWERYVGLDGQVIAMQGFGASAPASILFKKYGFTVDNVTSVVKAVVAKN